MHERFDSSTPKGDDMLRYKYARGPIAKPGVHHEEERTTRRLHSSPAQRSLAPLTTEINVPFTSEISVPYETSVDRSGR